MLPLSGSVGWLKFVDVLSCGFIYDFSMTHSRSQVDRQGALCPGGDRRLCIYNMTSFMNVYINDNSHKSSRIRKKHTLDPRDNCVNRVQTFSGLNPQNNKKKQWMGPTMADPLPNLGSLLGA